MHSDDDLDDNGVKPQHIVVHDDALLQLIVERLNTILVSSIVASGGPTLGSFGWKIL